MQRWAFGAGVRLAPGAACTSDRSPHWGPVCFAFQSSSLLVHILGGRDGGSDTWVPATCTVDPDGIPGFIWGVNHPVEALSLPFQSKWKYINVILRDKLIWVQITWNLCAWGVFKKFIKCIWWENYAWTSKFWHQNKHVVIPLSVNFLEYSCISMARKFISRKCQNLVGRSIYKTVHGIVYNYENRRWPGCPAIESWFICDSS